MRASSSYDTGFRGVTSDPESNSVSSCVVNISRVISRLMTEGFRSFYENGEAQTRTLRNFPPLCRRERGIFSFSLHRVLFVLDHQPVKGKGSVGQARIGSW